MKLAEFRQRWGRADFLEGLGIYVGANEVALAHVTKRVLTVTLRNARTFPLPPATAAAERRQALTQAVLTFAREHDVDARAYLCLPRAEAALSRVVLPSAARENLDQVLEYEMERLMPLPRDQMCLDYSVRDLSGDRLEVLLVCVPLERVRVYLDALEDAFVRPRGIVLTSTAIADYLAFCRGEIEGPIGLLIGAEGGVEFALVAKGRLVASQLVPASRLATPADLSRSLARQLADGAVAPEQVHLYRWQLANGNGPPLTTLGDGDLLALAAGRLVAPPVFFESKEPALLPAVGAALDAVREGTLPVNLLPEEGRRASDEGASLMTIALAAALVVTFLVYGVSLVLKPELDRRRLERALAARAPAVAEVKAIEEENADLRRQLDILTRGQDRRVTVLLKELSDAVPSDAYLTTVNLRGKRLELNGMARAAVDLIPALDKSKYLKKVEFSSPTTRVNDLERFSLVAEIER